MKTFLFNANSKKVFAKKRIRKNQILKCLRDNDILSYAEIARLTKFSLPMVSDLIKELLTENYIVPAETPELKVGRPPNTVRLNPDAAYIIGIDIGRTVTNLVVINLKEEIVADLNLPAVNLQNQETLIENLKDEIEQIITKADILQEKVIGIGIAIPGLVNSNLGRSYTYLNLEGQKIRDLIEERLNKHIVVENDANAMALGELHFGQARRIRNAMVINLGWGIGSGLILNGEIYRGKSGFAGEFGHIIVEENGPLCACGKQGCLETLTSGKAIGKIAKNLLKSGAKSRLLKEYGDRIDDITPESIIDFALKGDHFSIELLEKSGHYIGKCLGIVINMFNPERIILGGRGSRAGNLILNPIKSSLLRNSIIDVNNDVDIVISKLGYKAGSLGATTLITREIFETSHIDMGQFV